MDKTTKDNIEFVITRKNPAETFQSQEIPFNLIVLLVAFLIILFFWFLYIV